MLICIYESFNSHSLILIICSAVFFATLSNINGPAHTPTRSQPDSSLLFQMKCIAYAFSSLLFLKSFTTNAFLTNCETLYGRRQWSPHKRATASALYGVLSKAAILRAASKSNNKKTSSPRNVKRIITIDYVSAAIEEAIFRQSKILDVLSKNEHRSKESPEIRKIKDDVINIPNATGAIARRRDEIKSTIAKLNDLKEKSTEIKNIRNQYPSQPTSERIQQLVKDMKELGFHSLLEMDQEKWSINKERQKEFGRPKGFYGHVFLSPAGIPILVGKEKAHSDEILRRISQGADLWFQVSDYEGSRVLLRTSTRRGMKGSKNCMQMAADLAAYFSSHRHDDAENGFDSGVRVMYTDSKHVAKRGSKVGQMRQRKSLGYITGHPDAVENIVEEKYDELYPEN